MSRLPPIHKNELATDGHGPCDLGERTIPRALPLEAVGKRRYGVGVVLPDPDHLRAGLDTSGRRRAHDRSEPRGIRDLAEIFACGRLEPACRIGLDTPGDRKNQNLTAQRHGAGVPCHRSA